MSRLSVIAATALGLVALFAGETSCKSTPPASSAGSTTAACAASLNANPAGATWTPTADVATPVSTSFTVTVNPTHPALKSEWLQPHPEPLAITGGGSGLRLVGGVKLFALFPERHFLEVNVVNDSPQALQNVVVAASGLTGATSFYDFNTDPLSAPVAPGAMPLGGIGAQGVSARLRFGFDLPSGSTAPVSVTLTLSAQTTSHASTTSSPIAITSDGAEVWAPFADADSISVFDAVHDARVAQVPVPGRPSSIAITPDDALALVTCATCNQLTVLDRASRRVLQVMGESDGIGRDPRAVVISPDGARAYVSAYVSDTVTVLERTGNAFRVVTKIPLGRHPVGMSVTPDSQTVFVAHFMPRGPIDDNEGWVSVVGADTLTETSQAALRDDANAKEAGCLASISYFTKYTGEDLSFEAVPTQLAGVFLNPGGSVGWVPGLRTAGFPIFEGDLTNLGIDAAVKGANSPSMLFPLDTRVPRSAAFRKVGSIVDFSDRTSAFLQCVPASDDSESVTATPVPDAGAQLQYLGVTIPSGSTMLQANGVSRFVAYTKGGRRALVLSYNSDEIAVMDAATHSPTTLTNLVLSGSNPIGMVVTPDGTKGYVAYENSPFLSVLDLSAYAGPTFPDPATVPYRMPAGPPGQATIVTFVQLTRDVSAVANVPSIKETAQLPVVDADPMDATLRRGKVLFTSSSPVKYPTLSGNREASCSSCHPNGGNDGSAWTTMEGERRTIGLWGGTGTRGWLHASATHQSSYNFATTIVVERLGGTGLSPDDANALALYVAKGIPEVQRPPFDAELAATGKTVFDASCASCHSGADHGSGNPDPSSPYGAGQDAGPSLHNVGSATTWAHVALGDAYTNLFGPSTKEILDGVRGDRDLGPGDPVQAALKFTQRPARKAGDLRAPPLVNVYEETVFFHDARSASIADAVADIAPRVGATLTADQQSALVEYLKSL